MWVAASDLPVSPGHPFHTRLNTILDEALTALYNKAPLPNN